MAIQFKSNEELIHFQQLATNINAINFDFANKSDLKKVMGG
jgi:hypothetical protein